uniref:Uncharacterized protein n=1 Tax=Setaria italica TaxID=4555 RepID=K3ZYS3_SETIT
MGYLGGHKNQKQKKNRAQNITEPVSTWFLWLLTKGNRNILFIKYSIRVQQQQKTTTPTIIYSSLSRGGG